MAFIPLRVSTITNTHANIIPYLHEINQTKQLINVLRSLVE